MPQRESLSSNGADIRSARGAAVSSESASDKPASGGRMGRDRTMAGSWQAGEPSADAHLGVDRSAVDELPEWHSSRKAFRLVAPSWLISLLIHIALILLLAAITLDPVQKVISVLEASRSESAESIEQFDLQGPSLEETPESLDEPLTPPTSTLDTSMALPEVEAPRQPLMETSFDALDNNRLTESIVPSSTFDSTSTQQVKSALIGRSAASKSEMLERFGGSAESEKAVARGLKWIADHQAPNGGWTFAHSAICRGQCDQPGDLTEATNGATAMALLPFLGAGQTHMEGQYKQTVKRGLAFLINRMKVSTNELPRGSWHEPGGRMYSHGLAAITVCEAYAMTQDPDLLQAAQLSLNYLVYAQDPRGGGWRYEPKQPGDTSVVGWCVMALKSGMMGNLIVPRQTMLGAERFLGFVSTDNGAYYGYDKPTSNLGGRSATIAVGLLCRMYMGVSKEHPGMQKGIAYLSKTGPKLKDLYYTYYATQVMRHHGGEPWERWNGQLRDKLIQQQVKQGHAAGSWVSAGRHADKGGRLYATSLATMILEVYYRHMPLYSEQSSLDDFEI